jgi:hypothetical protein
MNSSAAIGAVMLLVLSAACSGCRRATGDDQRTETVSDDGVARARGNWPPGVAERVDSGNAAYSAQDYESASRHYRRAAELGPRVSAAWFGIYIAEHARGNMAAADSAMRRARQLVAGAPPLQPVPADTGARQQ